jgi:hypothetical protein
MGYFVGEYAIAPAALADEEREAALAALHHHHHHCRA